MSKDTHIEMWLHYSAFINQPDPNDAFDFVIVNDEVLAEINKFKEKEIIQGNSFIEVNKLLKHYIFENSTLFSRFVHKYGKTYIKLNSTEVDELCYWVNNLRSMNREGKKALSRKVEEVMSFHLHLLGGMTKVVGDINKGLLQDTRLFITIMKLELESEPEMNMSEPEINIRARELMQKRREKAFES